MSVLERATGAGPRHCPDDPGPHLLRDPLRVLVLLGVAASTALHGLMAITGTHGPAWSLVMAGMALLCLSCLATLLRQGRSATTVRTTMTMTMAMALAMALAHTLMIPLLGGGSGGHGAHAHHGAVPAGAAEAAASGAGHGSMLLVVVVELAVAALAVAWTRRHTSGPRPRPANHTVRPEPNPPATGHESIPSHQLIDH